MKPLHWSDLRWMRLSPAHYLYMLEHPRKRMSDAMRFGWLVDGIYFTGKAPAVVWAGDRRGKPWSDFKKAHPDEYERNEISTYDEFVRATEMAGRLRDHELARQTLDGQKQLHMQWTIAGRECAGTPDVISDSTVADLKVTNANPEKFKWHARRMGWHAQLAWYGAGWAQNNGGALPERYSIVAIEPTPPHAISVFDLSEACVEEGVRLWRSLFERLRVCEESNEWPDYSSGVAVWDVPDEDSVVLTMNGEEINVD